MPKRKLPPNETVVNLYRSGASTGEIAEMFNVAPVTVKSLLQRIGEPRRTAKEAAQRREETGRGKHIGYWTGKKQPQEMVEKRISKIRGPAHYLWKGGKDTRHYRKVVAKTKCERCSCKINLCIHHKDFDHYNDDPSNLEILCISCHISLHKQAYWDAIHAGKKPKRSNGPVGWIRSKCQ